MMKHGLIRGLAAALMCCLLLCASAEDYSPLAAGSSGSAVTQLQLALLALDYPV